MSEAESVTLEERFARESAEVNLRRARVMIPLVLVVHVAVVLFGAAPSGELGPAERAWWALLWQSHAVMTGVASALLVGSFVPSRVLGLPGRFALERVIGELTYAAYLAMGIASSLNDQRQFASNINAYVIAVLVPAIVFRLRLVPVVILHALGLAAFLTFLPSVQPSEAARLSITVIVPVMALLGIGLAYGLTTLARKEVENRTTLEAQRAEIERKNVELESKKGELESLNASLERRVAEQVKEIVAHAEQLDVFNAQLMERV